MASNPLHRSPLFRVGSSKAQAGLAKIIALISTIPPPLISPLDLNCDGDSEAVDAKVGFRVDLNLRLASLPETEGGGSAEENGGPTAYSGFVDPLALAESVDVSDVPTVEDSISPAESVAGDALTTEKSSEGECDSEKVEGEYQKKLEEEVAKEKSEIIKEDEEVETNKRGNGREGYLGLLLEAVRQVSGGVFDEEPGKEKLEPSPPPAVESSGRRIRSKRRRMNWTPFDFYEDSAPVVRSKRGRNQALPSRYRDSVLEPWGKLPTVNRHVRTAKP